MRNFIQLSVYTKLTQIYMLLKAKQSNDIFFVNSLLVLIGVINNYSHCVEKLFERNFQKIYDISHTASLTGSYQTSCNAFILNDSITASCHLLACNIQ